MRTMMGWLAGLGFLTATVGFAQGKPVELFNGKDLTGWQVVNGGDYVFKDGVLILDGGNGWLRTEREFGDFDLSLEWKADPKYVDPALRYDSGVFIRCPLEGKPWPTKKHQLHMKEGDEGGISGLTKASFPHLIKPPGAWNKYRVIARGEQVQVYINGQHAFTSHAAKVSKGYFGLQAEGFRFEFRNFQLTSFDP